MEELQREKGEAKSAAKAAAASEEQSQAKISELEQALGRVNSDLKGSMSESDRLKTDLDSLRSSSAKALELLKSQLASAEEQARKGGCFNMGSG